MDEGECVVFLGHSGSGKTSLLRLIAHEIQPTSGTVTVGTFRSGRLKRSHRALLRRTLGVIYEDFRLLNDRTVFENVALAVRIAGRFSDEEVIPRVLYALEEVGLQLKQAAFPGELSAGEKQRAAIARAIVNRPAVILADEPTGALERKSAGEILDLLRRIHSEGAALLLVTTRHEVAEALPARVLQLEEGRLPEPGAALFTPEGSDVGGAASPPVAPETGAAAADAAGSPAENAHATLPTEPSAAPEPSATMPAAQPEP
jgi:cell division transport system ATP-binding protein